MAEEAKKKEAPAPDKGAKKDDHGKADGAAPSKGGGLLGKLPVLLGGAMIIEAAVLFAGFKFLGSSPRPAQGAEMTSDDKGEGHDETAAAHDAEPAKSSHGAAADGAAATPKVDKKKIYEIKLFENERFTNKVSNRLFIYDVSIYTLAKGDNKEKVDRAFEERKNLIKDRVRTIIAQTDPEKLGGGSEPGLETLRRMVKYQLDEIIGEGAIEEVLVPKCIPFRSDN